MLTAEARIDTDRPSRYLGQLCQHIDHMSDKSRPLRHGPPSDEAAREQVTITIVESSDTHAIVDLAPWGRCTMRAEPNLLTLRLDATEEENLRRLQDVLTRNLTRFGRRDHLEVNWNRPGAPARRARWPVLLGFVLAKVAIVALVLALPSGLALSLGAGHVVALAVLLGVVVVSVVVLKLRGRPLRPALSLLRHKGHR